MNLITSFINQHLHLYKSILKHLKTLRNVSIFLDHHQGVFLRAFNCFYMEFKQVQVFVNPQTANVENMVSS